MDSIRKKDVVFGIGPAGTGKTYIAVAMAVSAFKNRRCRRLFWQDRQWRQENAWVFCREIYRKKVDPYLRPLYDALYDAFRQRKCSAPERKKRLSKWFRWHIRGRTLDNSFIILDEAQNTTREQMKMFLTRMGFGSKVVVTGDVTQIDLPRGRKERSC